MTMTGKQIDEVFGQVQQQVCRKAKRKLVLSILLGLVCLALGVFVLSFELTWFHKTGAAAWMLAAGWHARDSIHKAAVLKLARATGK